MSGEGNRGEVPRDGEGVSSSGEEEAQGELVPHGQGHPSSEGGQTVGQGRTSLVQCIQELRFVFTCLEVNT